MPDIKIGDNTLTGVSELQCVNADDTTQHVIFYSAPRAILAVTAPTGSVIDILQNGVILQTYTLSASETSHSFKVDVSTTNYMVRARHNEKTGQINVSVTASITYNIDLSILLPSGYTRLDYIRSSGTQYIKSGISGSSEIKAVVKIKSNTQSGSYQILGSDITWVSSGFNIGVAWCAFYNTSLGTSLYNDGKEHIIELSKSGYLVDNTLVGAVPQTSFSSGIELYIFACNRNGSVIEKCSCAISTLKLYSSGTIVRDYVAAKRDSDGALGLYDIVTNSLFTNAGSGTFIE